MPSNTMKQRDTLAHIEHQVALSVVQAIHRHLDPQALIEMLWSHAATLTPATGMHYHCAHRHLDLAFGHGRHNATYTLSYEGQALGELSLRFQQRVDDTVLGTVEDLLALAMPALRNAMAHREALERANAAEQASRAAGPRRPGTSLDDALVLVSLDGFDDIRTTHGDAWAQTLVQSIQNQIHEGLRDADSVFQIDEGLLAVLLPRTSEDAALDVAGKIRVLISGLHLRDGMVTSQLTACMGVVGARDSGAPEDVLARARSALTMAQREGRSIIRTYRAAAA